MQANSNEAMREALKELQSRLVASVYDGSIDCHAALEVVEKALALPRRQCDVGAPEEQEKRFNRFCGARHLPRREVGIYCAYKCPVEGETSCELQWAQMPYTESEATDGK